jgi:hypothetical protein
LPVVNVYDMAALKAFLEQEAPRWEALREALRRAGHPYWLMVAEQERPRFTGELIGTPHFHGAHVEPSSSPVLIKKVWQGARIADDAGPVVCRGLACWTR